MLLPEFDNEMRTTRSLLERVPENDAAFKPHEKSRSLGELAAHVANLPGLLPVILGRTEFDPFEPENRAAMAFKYSTTEALLQRFDTNISAAREALARATDEELGTSFTFRPGGKTIFALPRAAAVRTLIMSHLIHHRGQLSVYLRECDVPLPSLYGPTADTM
jgi:uncharacterized damage-inducible protein DinB